MGMKTVNRNAVVGYDSSGNEVDLKDPYQYQVADNYHGGWFEFKDSFTRASDTTFTVTANATNTEIFTKGTPIRFRGTGNEWSKYAMVTGYSSGTVTVSGGSMTTSDDDELWFGDYSRVKTQAFTVTGTFGDGTTTGLLAEDNKQKFRWPYAKAALVKTDHIVLTNDAGTQPEINIRHSGTAVYTAADATSTTWQTMGAPDPDEYGIAMDDSVEIAVTTAGGTGDAADLTVMLTYVFGDVYVEPA